MQNKDIVIITLVVLTIYLYYRQNNQPKLASNTQEIKELQSQVNHYQTLYQKRVEKDLEVDQSEKIKQLTLTNQQLESNLTSETQTKNLYSQKIANLENQLLDLARSKIKGQKDAKELLTKLESN